MRLKALAFTAVILLVSVVVAAQTQGPQGSSVPAGATVPVVQKPSPESILEVAYLLTWEKDPRFRGRDPFQTVLHAAGGGAKQAQKVVLPRTPSEELAFADKTLSLIHEAAAALESSDFKAVQDRLAIARQMVAFTMSSQAAKDKMAQVSSELASIEDTFARLQARAALSQALQIAARMQAYFESERYGDVLGADADLQALNNESGLMSPEVSQTAAEMLAKCAETKRRAEIHIAFVKLDIKVDAVSYFPEGQSFAIVNGEVYSEGAQVAPEMALAAVAIGRVTFDFKGEMIPQGLAVPEESQAQGKRGKEGRIQ